MLPAFTFIFGEVLDNLGSLQVVLSDSDAGEDERQRALDVVVNDINYMCTAFAVLGGMSAVISYVQMAAWELLSVRQTAAMRKKLLQTLLRQDIAYFDTQTSHGQLVNVVDQSVETVGKGLGTKVA